MTPLTRVTGRVFGINAPLDEIGVFGSAKAQNPTNSKSVAEIQGLPAYLEGWGSGIISTENFPPMEEVTGVLNTISYQACYLLQEGVPVYDANTEYSNTSIVKNISGNVLQFYISKINGNQNRPLTDTDAWQLATFTGSSPVGVPQFTMNPNAVLPDKHIWLEGQDLIISQFSTLYSIYGTTYGGDGVTTFKAPDFRDKYICGVSTDLAFGYVSEGLPDLQLTTTQDGAHTHTRGTMNIKGTLNSPHGVFNNASGAFSLSSNVDDWNGVGSINRYRYASFDASREGAWTGETSSNGAHTHSVTSGNSIVGTTDKIKVDGIKVRVYTRYE